MRSEQVVLVWWLVFSACGSALLVVDLFGGILRRFRRPVPKFGPDIDPARWDEYEAAIARLRAKYRVKPARKPRTPKAPPVLAQPDLLGGVQ